MPGDCGAGRPPAPESELPERILAFAGAVQVAVYVREEAPDRAPGEAPMDVPRGDDAPDAVPAEPEAALRLAETGGSGDITGHCKLPQRYALTGRSPVADVLLSGRPLWLDAAGFAVAYGTCPGRSAFPAFASVGVLPLRAAAGAGPLGCLLVVGGEAGGFGPEQRGFLERYADEIAAGLPGNLLVSAAGSVTGGAAGSAASPYPPSPPPYPPGVATGLVPGEPSDTAPGGRPGGTPTRTPPAGLRVLRPALDRLRAGGFTLTPGSGLITADPAVLDMLGIAPADFDGTVQTLLAHVVPEDLPALMALVEAAGSGGGGLTGIGGREPEFRVRQPSGDLRRLRLSCRAPGTAGPPDRLLGLVVDVSGRPRAGAAEVRPVRRLAARLAGARTVREVGRLVAAALREPLGADRLVLGQLESDRLVVTAMDPPQAADWPEAWRAEWRSEWPDLPVRTMPTLRSALRDGAPQLWPAGAALEPGLAGVGPGGLAVLPLPAQNRVVGACLVGWDRPHEFGPEERSLLTAAAGLIGPALMHALASDAEQELATMLQRTLLPRRLPALPGGEAVARYLPASQGLQVGGDWYDVISLSEDHVVLVIGDVQGHSAAAATIMGQMRTAVRAYAVEGHPPDVAVSHANRLLTGMETDLFATCCYVDLDMAEGDALVVRAGHLPPLLRLPDGGTEEVTVDGGPPLGVMTDSEFPMTAVALAPGTFLVLLTDGLVESARLHLEEGLRRVRDALAAADPADIGRMADDLISMRGPPVDDVALLLLRYDGMKVRPVRASSVVWRLPDAVMHARRFTARTLRSWQLTDLADGVLLVVSELVTNALVHTHGAIRLDLTLAADRLRIAVADSSPRAPAKPVVADWEATGGRGILLVEAMSAAWGSVPVSGGKQVWSEIVVPPREPAGETSRESGREPLDEAAPPGPAPGSATDRATDRASGPAPGSAPGGREREAST
jgi:anti-sigma regulatory factor (Ser/Thr protein kinase)/PAS domain-containing protein